MNKLIRFASPLAFLIVAADESPLQGQATNLPPVVSILWPRTNCSGNYNVLVNVGTHIKIKASATDTDGSIAQVQFFVDSNLTGVVSNAPFSVIWKVMSPPASQPILKVVAVDNLGATTESAPIQVTVLGGFPMPPVFEIISPLNKSAFAASAPFVFSAELLASPLGDTGSVEFFVGTNSVGIVTQTGPFTNTTPPYSINVTNIPEGHYNLGVRKGSSTYYFASGSCQPPVILVTKLGMQLPRLTPNSAFEFDVVTSFPTNQNVIEASSNLLTWTPISTNVPNTNGFTFTEPVPATNSPRFYRAVVPSQ